MALHDVVVGAVVYAADVDQLVNVLSQPSGGVESGHYRLAGASYITGATIAVWINSLSRNGAPVSITIDTTDTAPTGLNAPSYAASNMGGFLIYSTSTGVATNCYCAGKWSLTY